MKITNRHCDQVALLHNAIVVTEKHPVGPPDLGGVGITQGTDLGSIGYCQHLARLLVEKIRLGLTWSTWR